MWNRIVFDTSKEANINYKELWKFLTEKSFLKHFDHQGLFESVTPDGPLTSNSVYKIKVKGSIFPIKLYTKTLVPNSEISCCMRILPFPQKNYHFKCVIYPQGENKSTLYYQVEIRSTLAFLFKFKTKAWQKKLEEDVEKLIKNAEMLMLNS